MASALKAGSVAVDIIGNDRNIQQKIDQVQNRFKQLGKNIQNIFLTTAAIRTTLTGITQPLTQMFSVFSSFEMGMSKVKAITGATADEVSRLREQAKELGKTTFFTASQVADAQKFLAMAGFNPKQILNAIPDVLNLSLAGDMDLGMAADIATNISTPFKVAAEDLARINDVLAKSATTSNTNVLELGQAFKYVAPAAAAAGQSLEECGAAMSILANNGIKADMAGTSMRMMLIKLADAGIQEKLKEQFNIDVTDVTGKMRPLLSILNELSIATSNMGQTAQMSVFYDIFEQRAGTSAVVLGNAGNAVTDFRVKMMNAAGTAANMAKVMSDNVKGDWIAFMSAVEGSQIAFGDAVNNMSREWLQFGTTLVRGITEFITENKKFISTLASAATVGGGSIVTLLTLATIIKSVGLAVNFVKSAFAVFVPVQAAAVAAEQANAVVTAKSTAAETAKTAATATATAATNAETVAVTANTAAKTKNAAANAAYSAFKSGAIYGVAADTARLSRDAAISSADAFRASAAARMATAQASNVLTASEQRLALTQLTGASTTKVVTAETIRLATSQTAATTATKISTTAAVADAAAKTTATTATRGLSAAIMGIPGWGWAIAGVALLTSVAYYLSKSKDYTKDWTSDMKSFWDEIESRVKSQEKQAEIKTSTVQTDTRIFEVIKQFSGKPLNEEDFDFAAQSIKQLQDKYGDLGITIDNVSKTITVATDAQKKFNLEAGKQIAEEKKSVLQNRKQTIADKKAELETADKKLSVEQTHLDNGSELYNEDRHKAAVANVNLLIKTIKAAEDEVATLENEIKDLESGNIKTAQGKDNAQIAEEKLAESESLKQKIEEIQKKAEDIYNKRTRDRRTALENEIHDLKERNEEYKEYLRILIEAEKDPEKKKWLQDELNNADTELNADIDRLLDKRMEGYQKMIDQAGMSDFEKELANARAQARKDYEEGAKIIDAKIAQLDPTKDVGEIARLNAQKNALGEIEQNEVQKIYDKAKVDSDKLALSPMEKAVSDKMALRDAAVETGDLDKIKKAQKELEKAKRELEMTLFKRVQAALTNARTEYEQALEAFNNAKEGDEKAIAGNKLNEAEKKLDEIESRYDGMSEKQYNDKIKNLTDNVRKEALGEMFKSSGTFSAFELGNLDNSVAKEQLDELRIIGKEVKEIKRKKLNSPKFK
jgi:TP901 family phage tail tape measure protein